MRLSDVVETIQQRVDKKNQELLKQANAATSAFGAASNLIGRMAHPQAMRMAAMGAGGGAIGGAIQSGEGNRFSGALKGGILGGALGYGGGRFMAGRQAASNIAKDTSLMGRFANPQGVAGQGALKGQIAGMSPGAQDRFMNMANQRAQQLAGQPQNIIPTMEQALTTGGLMAGGAGLTAGMLGANERPRYSHLPYYPY